MAIVIAPNYGAPQRHGLGDAMRDIGKRIREARDRLGISGPELARRVDVSPSAVTQWETGVTRVTTQHLGKVARALNVSADWLLTGRLPEQTASGTIPSWSDGGRLVPLVSIDAAVRRAAIPSDAPQILTQFPCSEDSYSIELPDDGNAPRYPQGTRWVIDPHKPLAPGVYVLAAYGDAENTHAVRGQLMYEATATGRVTIVRPLNPAWEAARSDLAPLDIIGAVSEATQRA